MAPVTEIKRFERKTTSELVYETVRDRILTNAISSGVHLVEADIAGELGVSTTPVREALQRLVHAGLLDRKAARGVTVHTLSANEVRDIFEMRMILEPAGLRDSARFMDDGAWRKLDDTLAEAKLALEAGQVGRLAAINSSYHRGLIKQSRNQLLIDTIGGLSDRHRLFSLQGWAMTNHSFEEWNEHRAILDHARAGDIERACVLLREHIGQFMATTIEALERVENHSPKREKLK